MSALNNIELEQCVIDHSELRKLTLTQRQLCDLELLMNGGFEPLNGFMVESDYNKVCDEMRLNNGVFWPMPICLDVNKTFEIGEKIILQDEAKNNLSIMIIESVWEPNKELEALKVFGSTDTNHSAVDYLLNISGKYYIGGNVVKLEMPKHYDFCDLRLSPNEVKTEIKKKGWKKVVAFQTRNPLHRSHIELTLRAIKEIDGHLLLHPVVGMTKPGDVDHFTRVKCYKAIMSNYPENKAMLSLLPIAMRMGGPREALWHAIIRKNYGATHFIIGRDHAGPGNTKDGNPFYEPYAAQELAKKYQNEIGIKFLFFPAIVYIKNKGEYMPVNEIADSDEVLNISGTELRRLLNTGQQIPQWFSYPEVLKILQKRYPPKINQGYTIFLTGLSGAGKSTISDALIDNLMEVEDRQIHSLDGDEVRTHLSAGLGFTKEDRDKNIKRIGYVASLITKFKGIAVISAIAPYNETRDYVRNLVEKQGGFILIHVATPLSKCEERDVKGLYKKARSGDIKQFTGISDPYEEPLNAEITIDTSNCTVDEAVRMIRQKIKELGY